MSDALIAETRAALAGRYEIDREIGRGGMATVFLASDVRHSRKVAIKILSPDVVASVGHDRFRREVKLAASLTHPHILPILDSGEFGERGEQLWYASPYVEGESLGEKLRREGQLPVSEAARIVAEVAEALDYAHRQGVVHRDIKPDNILLPDGHVFVADFGIASSLAGDDDARLTRTGVAVGTPRYMSPEQATGSGVVDHRTSLGCVLYEAIVGRPRNDGATPVAIMYNSLTTSPPDVSSDRPEATRLQPILDKALAPIPADRFVSAGEMASALRGVVIGDGSSAQTRDSTPQRSDTPRYVRAARLVGLAALVGLLVAVPVWIARTSGGAPITQATVAVLPFRALGEGAEGLAASITQATRDRLAIIDGISVIGVASSGVGRLQSMATAHVARELSTDYVLTGTVALNASTGTVVVHPALFGSNGTQIDLWPDSGVEVADDALGTVEVEIATDIARELNLIGQATLAEMPQPMSSPEAYRAYMRGLGSSGPLFEARMQEALALDSTFALAHVALANAAFGRALATASSEDSTALLRHATAAIRYAPGLSGGYTMLGLFHRTVTLDFDSALVYLDQARALAPGSARIALYRASVLWSAGRLDAALVEARRGAGLDPLNYSATSRVSRILLWQHRYDEAWALHMELREPLVEAGRGSPFVMADGPLILAAQGLADSAQSLVARIPEASFSASIGAYMMDFNFQSWLVDPAVRERVCADRGEVVRTGFTYFDHDRLTGCALAAWLNDDLDHARVLADSARTLVTSVVEDRPRSLRPRLVLAYAHLLAGDTAQAIVQADSSLALMAPSWDFYPGAFAHIRYAQLTAMAGDVDRSVRELEGLLGGYSPLTRDWVRVDPAFDSIRDDARFKALLTAR